MKSGDAVYRLSVWIIFLTLMAYLALGLFRVLRTDAVGLPGDSFGKPRKVNVEEVKVRMLDGRLSDHEALYYDQMK